jgi:hypothetical protein
MTRSRCIIVSKWPGILAAAAASASAAARLLFRKKRNARPAIIPRPISTAATAIPADAPGLRPGDEFCDPVTAPVDDAAPAVPVVPAAEVDEDIDVDEEVEEEDDELLVVELDAAMGSGEVLDSNGLKCGISARILTADSIIGYPQLDHSPEVGL